MATEFTVERFDATDGDHWFSVVSSETGDLATCVMHDSRENAEREAEALTDAH